MRSLVLLQCVSVGLTTLNIIAASLRQAFIDAQSGASTRADFVLQKLDAFGLPAVGIALIVWTFGEL